MTEPTLDVLCIGNAIVDVITDADDAFLSEQSLDKGSMRLIDEAEAVRLYGVMGPGREVSGGSAGNTAAGLAALGIRTGFIGQVADDQLGRIYQHDIEAQGIDFLVPARSDVGATARCLILVTPDAQRTMNTFLGAAQRLERKDVDMGVVASAGITYLEGYLWDPAEPRAAMDAAIDAARAAGRKVAFTLSDSFCISRHRDSFLQLIDDGRIDILFANEAEITELAGEADFDAAVAAVAPQGRDPRRHPLGERRHRRRRCRPRQRPRRADRAARRHHWRGRSVRRGLPRRPGARPVARRLAQAWRDRRRRSDPALWRAARKRTSRRSPAMLLG